MKYILFVLLLSVSCVWACEDCDVVYKTEYDNSTVQDQYRTKMIEMATLMVKMDDRLTGDETYRLYNFVLYILKQSPELEERLIVLEDFIAKNFHRYKHEE